MGPSLCCWYEPSIDLNPLLNRLFLDHDTIFYFHTSFKNQEKVKVLNTFENIMENGTFAPKEQMLHFS